MTNEQIKEIRARAEMEYEMLKDKCHSQYKEIQQLQQRISKIRKHCKKEYFIDESGTPVIDKADELLEILGDEENE